MALYPFLLMNNCYLSCRLEWFDLLVGAKQLASEGVPVSADLASAISSLPNLSDLSRPLRDLITSEDGQPLKEGDTLVQPALVKTLEVTSLNYAVVFIVNIS